VSDAVADFLRYRAEARILFPMLHQYAIVTRDGPEPEWRHFNVANIPQFNIPEGYNVVVNQAEHLVAYHETGHEYEEWLRLRSPGATAHREQFLAFIGQTRSWDSLRAEALVQTSPLAQSQMDPGEWFAEQFANAVAGRNVVDLDHSRDPLAMRAFFQQLGGITPAPPPPVIEWEWVPAATDRYTPGRGLHVDTIILHSTATTMAGAIGTFTGGSRMVSAHVIVDVDRIVQMVDYTDTAWHCGSWPWNQRSVGLEFVDNGRSWDPRPEKLYENAIMVASSIRDEFTIIHMPDHRDIVATACPAGLDTDRIIAGVMLEMAFDPRANPADLAFLDQRIRAIIMNEPQLTGFALRRALIQYGVKPKSALEIARSKKAPPKRASRAEVLKGHGRGK
jgi:hypothetical protein